MINETDYPSYIMALEDYAKRLKNEKEQNPDNAKVEAVNSLIDAGLFLDDGTPKPKICNR